LIVHLLVFPGPGVAFVQEARVLLRDLVRRI